MDACHNAAQTPAGGFWNALMGHGALPFCWASAFLSSTRCILQHHAHVNDPSRDPDHIVSTFGRSG